MQPHEDEEKQHFCKAERHPGEIIALMSMIIRVPDCGMPLFEIYLFLDSKSSFKVSQTSVEGNKKSILKIKLKVKILYSFSLYVLRSSPQHFSVGLHSKSLNLRYSLKKIFLAKTSKSIFSCECILGKYFSCSSLCLEDLFKGELRTSACIISKL